jgi:hypothetical protein
VCNTSSLSDNYKATDNCRTLLNVEQKTNQSAAVAVRARAHVTGCFRVPMIYRINKYFKHSYTLFMDKKNGISTFCCVHDLFNNSVFTPTQGIFYLLDFKQ